MSALGLRKQLLVGQKTVFFAAHFLLRVIRLSGCTRLADFTVARVGVRVRAGAGVGVGVLAHSHSDSDPDPDSDSQSQPEPESESVSPPPPLQRLPMLAHIRTQAK